MPTFLAKLKKQIIYLIIFAILTFFTSLLLVFGILLCFEPENTRENFAKIYNELPNQFNSFLDNNSLQITGIYFLITTFIIILLYIVIRARSIKTKVIQYKIPRAEINVKKLEENLKESLSILSGITKSSVEVFAKKGGYLLAINANISVEEGIHISQLEKSIIHLLRKRVREILLGIAVEVKVKTNIKITPDKNYVSYNVIAEQSALASSNRNFVHTNFPNPTENRNNNHLD